MAKAGYVGIGGKARKLKKLYLGVAGKARKLKKMYVGIGGKARLWWSGNTPYFSGQNLWAKSVAVRNGGGYSSLYLLKTNIATGTNTTTVAYPFSNNDDIRIYKDELYKAVQYWYDPPNTSSLHSRQFGSSMYTIDPETNTVRKSLGTFGAVTGMGWRQAFNFLGHDSGTTSDNWWAYGSGRIISTYLPPSFTKGRSMDLSSLMGRIDCYAHGGAKNIIYVGVEDDGDDEDNPTAYFLSVDENSGTAIQAMTHTIVGRYVQYPVISDGWNEEDCCFISAATSTSSGMPRNAYIVKYNKALTTILANFNKIYFASASNSNCTIDTWSE